MQNAANRSAAKFVNPPNGSITLSIAAATFALAVVLVLANAPDTHLLLFTGGWKDGLFGLAMVALIPLIIVIQIGLGAFIGRIFASPDIRAQTWLLWLSGSAVLSLLGVALATAGWIGPSICGGLLVLGAGYAAYSGAARLPEKLEAWVRLDDVNGEKLVFAFVRLGIAAALILIGLRAATGELNDTDVVQFYWGWLNEVRHLGGLHLSPELPLIQDFAAGRGNGNYLFFAGVAPGLVSHVVSAGFCVMFGVGLRQFVLRAMPAAPSGSNLSMLLAADMACLAALWMLPGAVAFGKYHLQFAAWALGLMLVCLQMVTADTATARFQRLMLTPVVIAIPIGLAQFEAFIALVLLCAIAVAPDRRLAAMRVLPLLLAGCISAGVSLLANWFYLGIPDLNPFPLFERFIIDPRFGLWTSRLAQYYINAVAGGVLTLNGGDGVGIWRNLRSLLGAIYSNRTPIALVLAGLLGLVMVANLQWLRRHRFALFLLSALLGYALYLFSLRIVFYDLAVSPVSNRVVIYALATVLYLAAVRPFQRSVARSFVLGLLCYWLICATFILVFHSSSMDRLMRHADVVFVGLFLVALIYANDRVSTHAVVLQFAGRARSFRFSRSAAVPLILALGMAFSLHGAASAWSVDPPWHLLASTLGIEGRAVGLTHPMAKFERCEEIAKSVPATSRVLFLNAYTAMAYCNNAVLLPRTMIVEPHESDFARDIAVSSFAGAQKVEQTLRSLHIDYFLVLKGDSEFWASGLSAPFQPDQLNARFDLLAETPSFYILTWRGMGHSIPQQALAKITEWRRIAIQQHGFMAHNEFVGQWRAMANLGAERPEYKLGSRLDFTSRGWSALYADHGWYQADPEGTWTVGPEAVLRLPLAQTTPDALRLTVEVMPFVIPQLPTRTVHVRVGTTEVATWNFKRGDGFQTKEIILPPGAGADGKITLVFDIENSVSPYALGLSSDWRPLGISIRSLVLENAGSALK